MSYRGLWDTVEPLITHTRRESPKPMGYRAGVMGYIQWFAEPEWGGELNEPCLVMLHQDDSKPFNSSSGLRYFYPDIRPEDLGNFSHVSKYVYRLIHWHQSL